MATDQAQGFRAEHLRGSSRDVTVVDAMKTIAADALPQPRVRTRIRVGLRRKRRVKRSIEDRYFRDARSEHASGGFDHGKLQAIMSRRDFSLLGDSGADLGRDPRTLAKFSAVDDPVPGHIDPARNRSKHGRQHVVDALVWLEIEMTLPQRPGSLDGQGTRGEIVIPAFEAARSAVQDQNPHAEGQRQSRISGMSSPYRAM